MDYPTLLFHRIDPTRNMARFYALAIEPTLFGDLSLVRHWGRIGTKGRQIIELHADYSRAFDALERHAARRCERGYHEPQS